MRGPDWLTRAPLAHRGLHDTPHGIIENTTSAFEAAVQAGYGMEMDVQLSADGEAMVFHDAKFDRLTETTGRLSECTANEIKATPLTGTSDRIQTLGELLEQIDGRTPLLVEIKKNEPLPGVLEERTRDLLATYKGPFAISSFNPASVGWFASNAPEIFRGQISTAFKSGAGSRRPALQRFMARHLLINWVSRPHFISYDINHLPGPATSYLRKRGLPIVAWTVRTQSDLSKAKLHADNIIFEGFKPPLDWKSTHE